LGDTITEDTALQLLESDMVKAYQALFRLVHVPLTDNQQTALVSFIFNLGSGRFQASTLRQKLNRKEYKAASSEFDRWVYANDPIKGLMKLKGLVSRRRREKMIFLEQNYQSVPLKPHPDILPFKYYNKPRSSMPAASRTASLWQKVAVVFVGFFKTGQ
jgi:GH24 family phage-related lysozyme (muramidase)